MVDKGYYSKNVIENDHKCNMLCPLKKNANLKEDHNKEMFNRFQRNATKKIQTSTKHWTQKNQN